MKLPRNFFKPLAIGAPTPLRELPLRLERMIHFVPPHIEQVRRKVPELVAQVAFAEWTTDGRLRQPRFLGLRDDKRPAEVLRERPS